MGKVLSLLGNVRTLCCLSRFCPLLSSSRLVHQLLFGFLDAFFLFQHLPSCGSFDTRECLCIHVSCSVIIIVFVFLFDISSMHLLFSFSFCTSFLATNCYKPSLLIASALLSFAIDSIKLMYGLFCIARFLNS